MDGFSIALDVLLIGLVLLRQLRVRLVRRQVSLTIPFILAVIGAITLIDFTHGRHISGSVWGVVALSFAVGAVGFGYLRGLTVKLWMDRGLILRQGTPVTLVLWAISLGLHFGSDSWISHLKGNTGITTASALLYVGLSLAVQAGVVQQRAERLVKQQGPIDAEASVVDAGWAPPRNAPPGVLDVPSEPISRPRRDRESPS
jgi:hypothetical protein